MKTSNAFHSSATLKQDIIDRLNESNNGHLLVSGAGSKEATLLLTLLLPDDNSATIEDLADFAGLPFWFVDIYQTIFERMSSDQAPTWAIAALNEIPVGADLNVLRASF